MRLGDSDSRWVEFKFESLPVFCYLCGRLDHDEKECLDWLCSVESINAKDKQYGPWLRATLDRLQKTHVVLGQRNKERASPRQLGARLTERDLQPRQPMVVSNERHQPHGATETNLERVDVESWKMERDGITENLIGEKGNPDFEEQLRELDAEISGKADMGCNMEKVLKARELEFEVKELANQKEERGGKAALGCNMEKFLKARDLVSEVKLPWEWATL